MLCLGYAETQTARIGTMPHQTDDRAANRERRRAGPRLGQTDFCRSTGRVARARPEPAGGRPPRRARLSPRYRAPTVARVGERYRLRRRRPGRLRGASRAGRGRGPVRGRREGLCDAVVVGAAGPLAGAGRRAVGRQDAGPGRDRPPARQRREVAAAGQRRRGQPRASRGRPRARRKGRRARRRSRRADTIRCRPSARRVAVAR